ncbi:MAG: hypothetical protein ACPLTR_10600 [Thermacetogeniaceae bacterium]
MVKRESCIFVCNHAGVYGPVAMEIFFPYEFRPWVISDMVYRKSCRVHLEKELFGNVPLIVKPFCKLLTAVIEPIVIWVMREVNAIPVYKGSKRILETMAITIDALAKGHNIAIFLDFLDDDTEGENWSNNLGFLHLARDYYLKFGKNIYFYPVRIDRKNRRISIGNPMVYHPKNSLKEEKQRLMGVLAKMI